MSMHHAAIEATHCMVSTSAPSVQTPSMLPSVAPETDLSKILYKVITLYISSAWSQALTNANLKNSYPNLIHGLSFGSPIGNLPPINYTFIPDNLPLANIRPEYITNLINEEVAA